MNKESMWDGKDKQVKDNTYELFNPKVLRYFILIPFVFYTSVLELQWKS